MVELSRLHGVYSEAISASPCRAGGHGVRSGVLHQGEPGDVADLKRAVCCQSVCAPDGGDSDDRTMHCVFIIALQILILRKNYHPIQLMQLPVAFFFGYLTDFGVWAVPRDLISCVLAAVGPLPDRYFSSGSGSKPGSESGRRSARRRGRSSCDLPGAPG